MLSAVYSGPSPWYNFFDWFPHPVQAQAAPGGAPAFVRAAPVWRTGAGRSLNKKWRYPYAKTQYAHITTAALIGGIYVAMSYFGNIFGLTYGPVQCRFSEALTVLPYLNPLAAWGLFVGCVLSNILSPYGPLDLVFGSWPPCWRAFSPPDAPASG